MCGTIARFENECAFCKLYRDPRIPKREIRRRHIQIRLRALWIGHDRTLICTDTFCKSPKHLQRSTVTILRLEICWIESNGAAIIWFCIAVSTLRKSNIANADICLRQRWILCEHFLKNRKRGFIVTLFQKLICRSQFRLLCLSWFLQSCA